MTYHNVVWHDMMWYDVTAYGITWYDTTRYRCMWRDMIWAVPYWPCCAIVWQVAEMLFRPSLSHSFSAAYGGAAGSVNELGLHHTIARSIGACPSEIQGGMWRNVLLAGGNTAFSFLPDRLLGELSKLAAKDGHSHTCKVRCENILPPVGPCYPLILICPIGDRPAIEGAVGVAGRVCYGLPRRLLCKQLDWIVRIRWHRQHGGAFEMPDIFATGCKGVASAAPWTTMPQQTVQSKMFRIETCVNNDFSKENPKENLSNEKCSTNIGSLLQS